MTVAVGRNAANRAPDHVSSHTGLQIPEVVRRGPQSQPKLHAILRMKLYGGSKAVAGRRAGLLGGGMTQG